MQLAPFSHRMGEGRGPSRHSLRRRRMRRPLLQSKAHPPSGRREWAAICRQRTIPPSIYTFPILK